MLAKSARNQKQRIKNLWLYARVVIKTRDNFSSGSSRSFDNNCNEKVLFKIELCVTLNLLRLFHVGHVLQNRRSALSHALHEWFSCKGKDWKIYRCEIVLLSETQIWKFHVIVCQTTSKHCTKKRASRAARLFFFIQPIKSLDLWCCCWRLFTIYQKVSEISVGMYMVRLFWCSRPENFQNFRNVLKGSPKFPTGISEQKIC